MKYAGLVAVFLVSTIALPQLAVADKQERAESHNNQGKAYFRVKAYDKAIEEFEKSYRAVRDAKVLFNIGLAYTSLGNKRKAVEYFKKYVRVAPRGRRVPEARARIVGLERELSESSASERKAQKIEGHKRRASQLMNGKKYKQAAEELKLAYEASKDADMLFQIANAYRLGDHKDSALTFYKGYVAERSSGLRAIEARDWIQRIETERDRTDNPPIDKPPVKTNEPDNKTDPVTTDPSMLVNPKKVEAASKKSGLSWGWIGAGAAAIAAGVALDLAPGSSGNGSVDALDFVPLGLYGLGSFALIKGVF